MLCIPQHQKCSTSSFSFTSLVLLSWNIAYFLLPLPTLRSETFGVLCFLKLLRKSCYSKGEPWKKKNKHDYFKKMFCYHHSCCVTNSFASCPPQPRTIIHMHLFALILFELLQTSNRTTTTTNLQTARGTTTNCLSSIDFSPKISKASKNVLWNHWQWLYVWDEEIKYYLLLLFFLYLLSLPLLRATWETPKKPTSNMFWIVNIFVVYSATRFTP